VKVAYLSTSVVPSTTANSVQVMKTCAAIANRNIDLTLYARQGTMEHNVYEYYGIPAKAFHLKYCARPRNVNAFHYSDRKYAQSVAKKISTEELPDVFYGRDAYSLNAVSKFDKPLYFESHLIPRDRAKFNLLEKLFTKENFSGLIVTSYNLKEAYIKLFSCLDPQIVHVVQNGADTKQNCTYVTKANSVAYIGSLSKDKGIEIIYNIAKKMKTVNFILIGGNNKQLNIAKKRFNLPNISYLGHLKQEELKMVYDTFNIVLAPYLERKISFKGVDIDKYPSPLKIIEYMSKGKVIIASKLPMVKEVIIDNDNGILCDPYNIDCWINAISSVLEDSSKGKMLAFNARNTFESKFSWKTRAAKICNIMGISRR